MRPLTFEECFDQDLDELMVEFIDETELLKHPHMRPRDYFDYKKVHAALWRPYNNTGRYVPLTEPDLNYRLPIAGVDEECALEAQGDIDAYIDLVLCKYFTFNYGSES